MAGPASHRDVIHLGAVSTPSGALVLVDAGLLGEPWADVAPHAVEVDGIPAAGEFAVVAHPHADVEGWWRAVSVEIRPGEAVASSEPAGSVLVDWARILVVDREARAAWRHEEPIDGNADVVFWGLDAPRLAADVGAPRLDAKQDNFGWLDLPRDEAVRRVLHTEARQAALGLRGPIDFRPHSDHWRALEVARGASTGAATIEVGGALACLFFTMVGDGEFPVLVERNRERRVVRVRIPLAE